GKDRAACCQRLPVCTARSVNAPRSGELIQQAACIGNFKLARLLDIELLNHAITQQCGKALATHPHAPRVQIKFQAELASEFATAIAKHADATVHTERPAPSAHDEGVIDGYAPDFIHAFFPQGVTKFQKTWNVFFRACGCKGSRYGK